MEYLTLAPFLGIIESILKILLYLTLIPVGWKLYQALSLYIRNHQ